MGERNQQEVEILMREYEIHRKEIISIENALTKDFQILLAFIAAILALSVKQGSDSSLITGAINLSIFLSFSPILLFSFIIFFLIKLQNMILHVAYLSNVEDRINESLEKNLLIWESIISPNVIAKYNSTYFLLSLVFTGIITWLYTFLSYFAIYQYIPYNDILKNYSFLFGIFYFIIFPLITISLILKMAKDQNNVRKLIKNGFSKP